MKTPVCHVSIAIGSAEAQNTKAIKSTYPKWNEVFALCVESNCFYVILELIIDLWASDVPEGSEITIQLFHNKLGSSKVFAQAKGAISSMPAQLNKPVGEYWWKS